MIKIIKANEQFVLKITYKGQTYTKIYTTEEDAIKAANWFQGVIDAGRFTPEGKGEL